VLVVAPDEQEGKFEHTGKSYSNIIKVGATDISLETKGGTDPLTERNQPAGGALWDIFRGEDIGKLKQYLKKHTEEFMDCNSEPVNQVLIST
jgi:lysine-specific demethylase 3